MEVTKEPNVSLVEWKSSMIRGVTEALMVEAKGLKMEVRSINRILYHERPIDDQTRIKTYDNIVM